jgi:hypothetical protein
MSYDPTKRYTWSPEEKIELTGQEFATILNSVRSVLNLPEAPAIILADRANTVLDSIMAKNLESGIIKVADEPSMKINNEETND